MSEQKQGTDASPVKADSAVATQSAPSAAPRDPKADVEIRVELKAVPPEKMHLIDALKSK